jgi:hypothetical protein
VVVTLFPTEKQILELHHASIGEEQGWIVLGYQWTAGNHLMSAFGEIVQKGFTYIGAGFHHAGKKLTGN